MRLAFAVLAVAAATRAQDATQFSFPLHEVGTTPLHVATGDIDGDGHADVVTSNNFSGSISALLGRGDLSFDAARTSPAGDAPGAVALADLDGDGRLDALVTGPAGVLTLRGQGDGDFDAPVAHAAGGVPVALVVADIDGDGHADALAALPDTDQFALLRGDGAGGLLPAALVGVYDEPRDLVAADLDLDGDIDVVTANFAYPSTLTVRLGNGAGSFGPKNTFLANDSPQFGCSFVEAEDLDGDGLPELIDSVTGGLWNNANVLHGLGGGAFGPPLSFGGAPTLARLGDMNGDGVRDLVVLAGHGAPCLVGVRLADGAGSFGALQLSTVFAPFDDVALADFDGDGTRDIAFACALGSRVWAQRGDGAGHVAYPPSLALGASPGFAWAIALADGDLDGDLDAVVITGPGIGGLGNDEACVLPWTSGGFGAPIVSVLDSVESSSPQDADIGDLDGDGAADAVLIMRTSAGGRLRVALNDGAGHFAVVQPDVATGSFFSDRVALGDLDGDGDLDAVVAESFGSALLHVELNDGTGRFTVSGTYGSTSSTKVLRLRDVNLDGLADVLCSSGSEVEVRLAIGLGGLGPALPVTPVFINAFTLETGDLDEDGVPDLCWGGSDGIGVRVFHGVGDGTFTPLLAQFGKNAGRDLTITDVDLDGHLDVVFAPGFEASVSLLRGDGNGGLLPSGHYGADMTGRGPRVADLDGDGRPELVGVGGSFQPQLWVTEALPPAPWTDLGHALPGAAGPPRLAGLGTLVGGEPITLKIADAKPGGAAVLVIGSSALSAPFKGGTLVPFPTLVIFGLPLDAFGHFAGSGPWYSGLPSGTETFFQSWIPDAGGPKGFSATNGLRATSP